MAEEQSWDAFWDEVAAKRRTETIRGVTVTVPADLPLFFPMKLQQAWDSDSEEDFKALVADLFGADTLDAWIEAGMGMQEFQTVLAWGMGQGSGKGTTFAEALEMVRSGQGKAEPANRAERRRSAGTGGPSKRTSNASTGSRRKTSRA